MERTRRQEIRGLLLERAWTLDELAARYLVPKRVLVDDLEHIARSIAPLQKIEIQAPVCGACGFRFRDRTRFSDPSRCPQCKNEHLSAQHVRIV
jgi:predicted Zn-ribbon and HTH transcriptional regulator